jgi:flagellar hook protein FlgE
MASFFIPLTGLEADSTALNTIANNLSNMNTTAYKTQTTNFSDLFYEQLGSNGSGDKIQVGSGVQVASNTTDFKQGDYDTSGTTSSDVALDGNGFFVVNEGGTNVYTRDGAFTQNSSGNLVTSDGLQVMGYAAVNGVVKTSSGLTAITIPKTGAVEQPKASSSFSISANLDSAATVGTTYSTPVVVYDSLGLSYNASVTYTKLGTNSWSYAVSMPDTLTSGSTTTATGTVMSVPAGSSTATSITIAAASTAGTPSTLTGNLTAAATTATNLVTLTPSSAVSGPNTLYNYNFGTGGTADATSTLNIGGTAVTVTAGESVSALATQITGLGITGVSASATGNVLTITAPTGTTNTGNLVADLSQTANAYTFATGGSVDPTTALTITGQTASGTLATTVAPAITAGENITTYATALNNALLAKGIANVSVVPNTSTNTLTITGANMTVNNSLSQNLAATTTNYTFNTGGTVDSASNLTITGQTATGATATITAPTITTGETLSQYATALTSALSTAGITNVSVTPNTTTNQLSVTGANMSLAGSVSQDLSGATTDYNFGTTSTVDPATNFTITGQTATGATATITAPTVTKGETVTQYATALSNALAAKNIVGVTVSASGGQLAITGANVATAGAISQDESATTTSYSFGSSAGQLATVDPSTNLVIAGLTATGASASITAPTVTAGETLTTYAAALNTALNTAGVAGVTVSVSSTGVLSITGTNVSTSGNLIQDDVASSNSAGTMTFNSSGTLVSPAADIKNITFSGLADGASNMNLNWNILSSAGTPSISQEDSASSLASATADGYATGVFESFTVSSDGTIVGSYSNGQTPDLGQLALANVANLQGLTDLGNGVYETNNVSGVATIGVSGTDGLGTVKDSSLEESNVSISSEFSSLIIAQRAFEANAKAITTFDTVTSDTIGLIRS